MKSNPVGVSVSVQQWLRPARLFVALGAIVLGVGATRAQQFSITTLAGQFNSPGSADSPSGPGSAARFNNPHGAAVDSAGNLYIADTSNHTIRRITPTGVVTTVAGLAGTSGTANGTGGAGGTARFNSPQGVAVNSAGTTLYVADTFNHAIRAIDLTASPVNVTTLAGLAGPTNSGSLDSPSGPGGTARFNFPIGLAFDGTSLFVADSSNHSIRRIIVATGVVSTLAGPDGTSGNTPGTPGGVSNANGAAARFNVPFALAVDNTRVFVADRNNHAIRAVNISTRDVTLLAGTGVSGSTDAPSGPGTIASFANPSGIAVDSNGSTAATTAFVTEAANHTVRRLTLSSGAVITVAGQAGASGFADGIGSAARFTGPNGIGLAGPFPFSSGSGTFYVADTSAMLIRQGSPAVAPAITSANNASFTVGSAGTFTVVATGSPASTFTISPTTLPSGLTFTSNTGANTATIAGTPAAGTAGAHTFTITANNGVTPAATQTFTININQVPVFTSANSTTFATNTPGSFQVAATGFPTPTFTIVAGSLPGSVATLSSNGLLTSSSPSSTAGSPFSFTIRATNTAGFTDQPFTLTVSATTPPSLTGPNNVSLASGITTATFSVTATGTPSDFTYQWQRRAAGASTFTALTNSTIDGATYSGVTTPALNITGISPSMNGDAFRVVVSSTGGSTTSTAATLSVAPVITSPNTITFVNNQTNSFTVQATGNPAPTINITGTLPAGVTLTSNGFTGQPTDATTTQYPLTITATNTGGVATQSFTLTVSPPQVPVFTSAATATFQVGQAGTFTFTAAGAPTPTFQLLQSPPAGLVFSPPVLSGTPTTAAGSPHTLTVLATNTSGSATQTFTLVIQGTPPTITTHPVSVVANVGATVTFTAAATGEPAPTIRWQRQPSGTFGFINLTDDGTFSGTSTNTLTITGVTAAMSLDQFRIIATNGVSPDPTSNPATLTVNLGTVITTIAGQAGFAGSTDGIATIARFNSPSGVAVDLAGNVYIADTANHVIRKMTAAGIVTTIAGAAGFSGSTDGLGSVARFNSPQGVAVDTAGNVYVADTLNHTIRLIMPDGTVSTVAGTAGSSGAVDGDRTTARFSAPTAIAFDVFGLLVADTANHAIRRVQSNGTVSTHAGVLGQSGHVDGGALGARFNSPAGLVSDTGGNVYVSDSLNHVIRRISGGSVTTIAGAAGSAGFADGSSGVARFNRPTGIAIDSSSNLYVADTLSSTLRRVTLAGDVTTVAGQPLTVGTTDGAGSTARFNQPVGVAIDVSGNIYIADTRNHTIRRSGSTVAPAIQQHPANRVAAVGSTVTFTASASGAPTPGYQWQRAAAGTPDAFVNLTNDGVYSGVNTATLTINNVTTSMSGDRFRVVANNGVPPAAVSNSATLVAGVAPTFTSPTTATFQAGVAGTFRVAVSSDPASTFTATGLPSWATLNAITGEITGTPSDTSGSPFTVQVTANNGALATQTLILTVTPPVLPPTITAQPANVAVSQGQTASFTVGVSGTPPFTYQWRRNGAIVNGATGATLTLANVEPSAVGIYTVTVSNAAGTAPSSGATLTVNTAPLISVQPSPQLALAGTPATFSVTASGSPAVQYQWRRNGLAIAGATNATLTVPSVSATDAGNYDVIVTNSLGTTGSSLAQLSIATGQVGPVISAQPGGRTALVGSPVTLSAAVTGVPSPTYQWYKNGILIPGATGATLTFSSVGVGDIGGYQVVATNAGGAATSSIAVLNVIARSYAGAYFGSFGSGLGDFALHVRDDNTGVFLAYLPQQAAPVMNLNVTVSDSGQFSFSQGLIMAAASNEGEPDRAAALNPVVVSGTINADGAVTGSIQGGVSATLTGTRGPDSGGSANVAGFYQAGATNNAAVSYTIVGPHNLAFAIVQSGNTFDGGRGTVSNNGQVMISTARSTIVQGIDSGRITGSVTGAISATLSGATESFLAQQRLVNISSRARVGAADAVAIAGFVISGEVSKPVLIRAVGPTLAGAPFNVTGALAAPRLELFRAGTNTAFATNTGVGTNRAAIDAAGAQAGAFPLAAAGTDAAIFTTLAPGNYTAVVSSNTAAAGVALVEVYDLSGATPGQKLLNISTRAAAGTNENTLIAGFVVPPGPAKRVLVRGIGPGLAVFGVSGTLPAPTLTVWRGQTSVATSANWSTGPDVAAISAASAQVGAFGMAAADAAVIVTLESGNYTAQVSNAAGASGVALIEVYELP